MHVREATSDDVAAIREVHRASIEGLAPEAYDPDQVAAWARGCESADYGAVESDDYAFLVAEDGSNVVGFGSLLLASPDAYETAVDAEITGVYVHPSVAREGVGSRLLDALERRSREAGRRTVGLTASRNAVSFYEARGYERVRERVHEFSSEESTGVEGRVVEMRADLEA